MGNDEDYQLKESNDELNSDAYGHPCKRQSLMGRTYT